MRFRLLGTLEVGNAAVVRGARERKLLGLLLLEAPAAVSRHTAADWVLGADRPADDAGLSVAISRLRRQLREHDLPATIERSPAGLRLVAEADTIDSSSFKGLLVRARALPIDSINRQRLVCEALALWRGEVLMGEDLPHHPALTELTELRFAAFEERFELGPAMAGDPRELAELLSWCRAHPHRERLWALAMRCLYRAGRHVDALALYQEARRRLMDTLGLEPGPDLIEVERQILLHHPSLAAPRTTTAVPIKIPPPRRASALMGMLPRPQTSFVGRAVEVEEVAAAVQRVRLVTLVGAGGMGKTRLAVEAAAALTDAFPDGACFVELAPLGSNDAVFHAVSSALSVTPDPGTPLLEAIVDRLAPQRTLFLTSAECRQILPVADVFELVAGLWGCRDVGKV